MFSKVHVKYLQHNHIFIFICREEEGEIGVTIAMEISHAISKYDW